MSHLAPDLMVSPSSVGRSPETPELVRDAHPIMAAEPAIPTAPPDPPRINAVA